MHEGEAMTISDVEATVKVCRTAADVTRAAETKAREMFHTAWSATEATFGDWLASYRRAFGGPPSGLEAGRSGWCPFHPGVSSRNPPHCGLTDCKGRGCPGPLPEPATPEEWAARYASEHGRVPDLSDADAAGWCASNSDVREACGVMRSPGHCTGGGCGGRGCPGPAPKAEPEPTTPRPLGPAGEHAARYTALIETAVANLRHLGVITSDEHEAGFRDAVLDTLKIGLCTPPEAVGRVIECLARGDFTIDRLARRIEAKRRCDEAIDRIAKRGEAVRLTVANHTPSLRAALEAIAADLPPVMLKSETGKTTGWQVLDAVKHDGEYVWFPIAEPDPLPPGAGEE
jgi:hypothetical protein